MATFTVRLESTEPVHKWVRELTVNLESGSTGIEIVRAAEKLGERLGLTGFMVAVVGAGAVVRDNPITPEIPAFAEIMPHQKADLMSVPSVRSAEWRIAHQSVDALIGPRKPKKGRSGRVTSLVELKLLGEAKPL